MYSFLSTVDRFLVLRLFRYRRREILPHYQLIRLLQKLRRDWAVQLPGDIHRPAACVLHVVRRAQMGVRLRAAGHTVRLKLTDKQQHLAAAFLVVDIALTGGRILRCGALALPMEQALIDGIIVVHGGWRIVLVRLVQRHKEHVDVFLRQPLHALTNGGRLHKVQRHQELVAGIGAVQIQ